MRDRGQSSVEFISIYSFAFLIIAFGLALIFSIASIPKSIIPTQCSLYGGLTCVDTVYASSGPAMSKLFIEVSDGEQGILNISTFNAILNTKASTSGYCTPNVIYQGGNTICIADFASVATTGILYSGTFKLTGNYCTPAPGFVYNTISCPTHGNQNYTFSGSIRLYSSSFNSLGT
jgi:hypothetical protein